MSLSIQNLDEHRKLANESLQNLRTLRSHAEALDLGEVTARLAEVIGRVEEDVFRIAVVGEFKRGKSTLINALLGQEILPADVLPCSATLNRVTFGLTPKVELVFRPGPDGKSERLWIEPERLSDYVTKLTDESARRAADVEEAVVYYPTRFCKDKADIIDTPGLNDDEAMTSVTMRVLPRVDAALFVILAQSPFSGYEADFLNKLLTQDLGRVIFVVNRIDEIRRDADKQRILDVVRARIEKAVRARATELHGEGTPEADALIQRIGKPRVVAVSGADALDGRLQGDDGLLQRSGFPILEAVLERFLAVERGAISLMVVSDAGVSAARKVLAQASIRRGALGMQAEQFEAAYVATRTDLERMRKELDAELARIEQSARTLNEKLRPRAAALPPALIAAAERAIDGFPLDEGAVKRSHAPETAARMGKAVLDAVQAAARVESERLQAEIEDGVQAEVAKLVNFGERMEQQLGAIELRFQAEGAPEGLGDGITVGANMVASGLGGWLVGGIFGGAFTGYQVAGLKGAAVGAAAGAVTGFGAILASGLLIGALGLPVTWPVLIPAMLISGLASSFGARWFTRLLFGGDRVDQFRKAFREAVLEQLQRDSAVRVAEVERTIEEQVSTTFASLRARVQTDLGGVVEQTKRTLEDLKTQRTRSGAHAEKELASLQRTSEEVGHIEARLREVGVGLRALEVRA